MSLASIIQRATKPPKCNDADDVGNLTIVDASLLQPIKKACQGNCTGVQEAMRYLLILSEDKNTIIKSRALYIIDYLFWRVRTARSCVNESIRTILKSARLVTAEQSSLRSTSEESYRNRVLELIELWDAEYGNEEPGLRAAARYLRETLRITMPNVRERLARQEEEKRRKDIESIRTSLVRKRIVLQNLQSEHAANIQKLLDEMECCFELLIPSIRLAPLVETSAVVAEERFVTSGNYSSKKRRISNEIISCVTLNDLHNSDSEDSEGAVDHVEGTVDCAENRGGHERSSDRKIDMGAEKICADEANVKGADSADGSNRCVCPNAIPMASGFDAHTGCSDVNKGSDDIDDIDWEDEVIVNVSIIEEKALDVGVSINGGSGGDYHTYDNGGGDFDYESLHGDTAVAPYDLEISVPLTASALESSDNKVILQTIRELAVHMNNVVAPRLIEWKDVLSQACAIYERIVAARMTSSHAAGGQQSAFANESSQQLGICDLEKEHRETEQGLGRVNQLLRDVEDMLHRRCETLLGSFDKKQ